MPTHHVPLIQVLKPDEYERIDRFCKDHAGIAALPAIADLLRADFATELVLDPDIIQGFTADSSNLPGHADALGRPQSEHECAAKCWRRKLIPERFG